MQITITSQEQFEKVREENQRMLKRGSRFNELYLRIFVSGPDLTPAENEEFDALLERHAAMSEALQAWSAPAMQRVLDGMVAD